MIPPQYSGQPSVVRGSKKQVKVDKLMSNFIAKIFPLTTDH
jgi:hypothetical protein